jgi:HPt (histidine-containing phosphotransfer) domain-containing protein
MQQAEGSDEATPQMAQKAEERAPSPAADAETLDPAALDNLRQTVGDDEEFLAELVDTFLEDAPQMLADMRRAAESGDAPELRLHAHSLKSNSAEFGAMALSALSKQLEIMGKENQLDGALPLVDQADALYEAIKPALEALK